MKSRNKKRLLALVLCMVVAISNSSFIFASETGQAEYPQEAEVQTQDEAVANDMDVAAYAADEDQAVAEEQPAPVEQVAEEPVAEPEAAAETQAAPVAETPVAEQPTTEEPTAQEPAAAPTEKTAPAAENTTAEEAQVPQEDETVTYNQKMDLKQDFTDELGNVVATVSAEIPEGAFQVEEGSQITMEVSTLTDTEKAQLESLMKEKIPAEKELGQYVAYNIRFKVDGTETESLQPIKITMTGDKTQIDDVENATVFYLDPADPTVPGDKDELEEIIQRVALIKSLQEAGQSIDNIDEDYDLSDITLGTDGAAEKIQLEGRTSTIYGCYVENTPEEDVTDEKVSDEEPADDETVSDEILNPATLAADTTGNAVTLSEDNGKLTASYTGGTDDYGFVWYRSINGGDFEAQEPTTYTSSTGTNLGSDIKEDGSELYIALNGGALGYKENGATNEDVRYKVAAFRKTDIKNNGIPKDGTTAVAESREYSVTSYYEVRNGGFETPDVQDKNAQYNHYQYSNSEYASSGGVWQTTGTGSGNHQGHDIEIINTKDGNFKIPYSWNGNDGAAEGNQFAELNCEAEGALYQDILTTPGETLNYQLSHRARGLYQNATPESDTMYVLIMSTKLAKQYEVTTAGKAQEIVNHPENYSGATVVQYTDNDQKWTTHQGVYNVPANSNQYLTRFFFVAGTTASRDNTVGNFLDNIKLTRDKLTPVEGTATITLEKVIVGLKYAEARSLAEKLTFTVGNRTVSGSDLNWTWSGAPDSYGTYTGTTILTISQSECGTLDLQEQATSGNSLEVTGYNRSTSLFIDGSNTGNSESGTIDISNKDAKTVSFRNIYSLKSSGGENQDDKKVLSHEKYIKRNSNGTYDITLNVSGTVGTETKKAKVDIVLVMDVSSSMDGTNIDTSKKAVNALVTEFNKKTTVDVQYKLITFGTDANVKTNSWTSGDDINRIVQNLSIEDAQGTNYDQGLDATSTAIQDARSDAKKIVIFLTDGQPTYYGESEYNKYLGYRVAKGRGRTTSQNTLSAALNSAAKISCDQFYAVGLGLPTSIPIYLYDSTSYDYYNEIKSGQEIIRSIKDATNANKGAFSDAWNLQSNKISELPAKFKQIAGSIITIACENVVITDKLSKYVNVTEKSKLRVKIAVKNPDGTYKGKLDEQFPLTTGGLVTLNGGKQAVASYDADTKTAQLTFDPSYQLEKDYYYYITITNVTPTEEAFKAYEETGYNAVGDVPTDESANGYYAVSEGETASGKVTSSGKRGFQSNEDAYVDYTYNGVQQPREKYDDPVIQVEQISVKKEWVGVDANDMTDQTILVQLIDKNDNPVPGKILKLTSQNSFTGRFAVEETNNYNGVRELVLDNDNGKITFGKNKYSMVDGKGITVIDGISYEVTYSEFKDGKQTITNTKNSDKIKIIKTGTNTGLKLKGAEFTLEDSAGNLVKVGSHTGDTYVSGDEGLILEGNIKKGTYTLKEVKAPEGYMVLPDDITITVSENGVAVAGSDKVSCEKDKDEVYVITVRNEVVYDLPSTGHTGIFNIMMSGILLMFVGVLIIFKLRGKEVLKK